MVRTDKQEEEKKPSRHLPMLPDAPPCCSLGPEFERAERGQGLGLACQGLRAMVCLDQWGELGIRCHSSWNSVSVCSATHLHLVACGV